MQLHLWRKKQSLCFKTLHLFGYFSQLSAVDTDAGANGQVTYRILAGDQGHFHIGSRWMNHSDLIITDIFFECVMMRLHYEFQPRFSVVSRGEWSRCINQYVCLHVLDKYFISLVLLEHFGPLTLPTHRWPTHCTVSECILCRDGTWF